MRQTDRLALGALLVATALVATGCATKKYVAQEVGTTNKRVDDVQSQVEVNQTTLREHDARISEMSSTAQDALDRAIEAGKLAEGKFLYETVLSDDTTKFAFDSSELSDEARAAVNTFAGQIKSEDRGVYIEIQGHTDSTGDETYNVDLGQQRADAVWRYLSQEHGFPLARMNTISYGESEPVSDNGTREGRTQNRRVALVVLR
ncbi:MAG: OmpA family protein [Thermoanaerobaculia bacterium]